MFKTLMACVVFVVLAPGEREAHAQGHDSLMNGTIIGAAVGTGAGIAFTHAVRDSDLSFSQYAYGALIFGAIGAGVGLSIDALFNRASQGPGATPRRVLIFPIDRRDVRGAVVKWRW